MSQLLFVYQTTLWVCFLIQQMGKIVKESPHNYSLLKKCLNNILNRMILSKRGDLKYENNH